MGWFGHDIYDGDETQTRHYDYLKWAKVGKHDDEIDTWLTNNGTILPKDKLKILSQNVKLIIRKMPKVKFWDEYKALDWQMLGALFVDNKLKIPKIVKQNSIIATEYLMEEDASEFTSPGKRRKYLRNFISKLKKLKSYNL